MKNISLFIFFSLSTCLYSQNLVRNPSFEEYNICTNFFYQISYANYCSAGCEYGNHDEYFNCCMLNDPNIDNK